MGRYCLVLDAGVLQTRRSRPRLSGRSPSGAWPTASTIPRERSTAPSLTARRASVAPLTARTVLGRLPAEPDEGELDAHLTPKTRSICQLDPGWLLWRSKIAGSGESVVSFITETPWWPANLATGPASEFLGRLWRNSVAVSLAVRSLAGDANDPNPDGVARAAFLCRLGWWAVASVDAEWLATWWRELKQQDHPHREITQLGTDLDDLGRSLAERWGCDPLTVDAAWLHGSHGQALLTAASDPVRLAYIEQACRWAEQTPWSLDTGSAPEELPPSPDCASW